MTPQDWSNDPAKVLGGIATTAVVVVLGLRKWLSRDAVDRASDSAALQTIERLQSLLDAERIARREAERRADQFAHERNELVEKLGELRGQILALGEKVQSLEQTISTMKGQSL